MFSENNNSMLKPMSTIGFVTFKPGQMLAWAIDMLVLDIEFGVAIRAIDVFDIRHRAIYKITTSGAAKGTTNMGAVNIKLSFCGFFKYLIISYLIPSVH
jgi:hypothetical protein